MTTQTKERTITVDAGEVVRAAEFKVSCGYSRPENWMYFDGVFCMDFFDKDERPNSNDIDGYQEWLKLTQNDDTDVNFALFIQSNRDYYKSILLDTILIFNTDDELEEEIKVIYV